MKVGGDVKDLVDRVGDHDDAARVSHGWSNFGLDSHVLSPGHPVAETQFVFSSSLLSNLGPMHLNSY